MTLNDETSAAEPSDAACPRAPDPGDHPRTLDPGDRPRAPDSVSCFRAEHPEEEDPLGPLLTDDLLYTMMAALPSTEQDTEQQKNRRQAAAAIALRSFDAQEPIEAMLATHVVLAHHAGLACYRFAARDNHPPALASRLFGNAANLSRTLAGVLRNLEQRQDRAAWLAGREVQRWCR